MNGENDRGSVMRAGLSALMARAVAAGRSRLHLVKIDSIARRLDSIARRLGRFGLGLGPPSADDPIPAPPEPRLVRAAFPLLDLVGRLPRLEQAPDPDTLHYNLIGALRRFQSDATAAGFAPEQIRLAHFLLCATVDAAVRAAPWSQGWQWEVTGLLPTFHRPWQESPGLDGVLQYLLEEEDAYPDGTALARFCLLLGPPSLTPGPVRAALCRGSDETEARAGERPEAGSAPVPLRPLAARLPLWAAVVGSEFLMLVIYFAASATLEAQSSATLNQLEALLPATQAELIRVLPVAMARTPPASLGGTLEPGNLAVSLGGALVPGPGSIESPSAEPSPDPALLARHKHLAASLTRALGRDISAGNVTIVPGGPRGADNRSSEGAAGIVRVPESRLFAPGQSAITPNGRRLLQRLGTALERESGILHVTVHTDEVSAQSLDSSETRARAVAAVLRSRLSLPGRVGSEGRGGSEPLPTATAPLGHQGRVDILIRDRASGAEP